MAKTLKMYNGMPTNSDPNSNSGTNPMALAIGLTAVVAMVGVVASLPLGDHSVFFTVPNVASPVQTVPLSAALRMHPVLEAPTAIRTSEHQEKLVLGVELQPKPNQAARTPSPGSRMGPSHLTGFVAGAMGLVTAMLLAYRRARSQRSPEPEMWISLLAASGKKARKSAGEQFVQQMPGITAPTVFFDPAGLSHMKTPTQLRYSREAELKHGRVAMLAALGFPFAEEFHPIFPEDKMPSDFSFQLSPLQTYWPLVLLGVGALELFSIASFKKVKDGKWELMDDHESGDLGWDPLSLKPSDPDRLLTMQNKELNNGRLAMIGIAGMVAQELVTRMPVLEADVGSLYTDIATVGADVEVLEKLTGISMFAIAGNKEEGDKVAKKAAIQKAVDANKAKEAEECAVRHRAYSEAKERLESGGASKPAILAASGVKGSGNESTEFVQQMPGITPPTGFFDPAGLSRMNTPSQLRYSREAELKHGRVAMLAALGFPFAEEFHPIFPEDKMPSDFSFQLSPLQTYWPLVLLGVGALELFSIASFKKVKDGKWELMDDHESGDLGWDPLSLKPSDPDRLLTMQNKELNNGRLAMIGIAGMVAQELVTRMPVLEADVGSLYTDIATVGADVEVLEKLTGISMFATSGEKAHDAVE